ncbi:MAG: TM0106 family RecB-like putative nuclease [Simkaniaceae bacterium]
MILNSNSKKNICITPSHLFQYSYQPLWIWYDLFGDSSKKEPLSSFAMKILEDGVLHEKQVIQHLSITSVDTTCSEKALKETLALMQKGEPLIYQGSIQAEIESILYYGRPDLLQKVEGSSIFGDWTYMPIDIKSSNSIKPLQKYQLIIYGWILSTLLKSDIPTGTIINSQSEYLAVDLINKKDQDKARSMCSDIADIMRGKRPGINVTSNAKNSPWYKLMYQEALSERDISLIYKLDGRSVKALRDLKITTIDQFLQTNIETLPQIPYAPFDKLQRAQLQAQSLIENKIIWFSNPNLAPEADLKLFFDIEGSPWEKVEYLFGFWIVGDPEKKLITCDVQYRTFDEDPSKYFLYFLAESPDKEEELWKNFLRWIETLPSGYQVIHYADYERSHINSLAEKYGDSDSRQAFMTHMLDLEKVIQKSVIFPLHFYSIKDIAKSDFLGFKWRHEKAGGSQSIFWYEEWLETSRSEILDDIINYNEDDVRATEHLYLWLKNRNNPNTYK